MSNLTSRAAGILSVGIFAGLATLGWLGGQAAIDVKSMERTVSVKGLSEREYPADVVIWPIMFSTAGNDLGGLYQSLDTARNRIVGYLSSAGISADSISYSVPSIIDKSAQSYGGGPAPEFRYNGTQTVTVYSPEIDAVRKSMTGLGELGREGIIFTGDEYNTRTEYLFTRLNEIKPEMIQEATTKAREVADKFAQDSKSSLGKIRSATQGQFSIDSRDTNNPHIKKIRVVSTVEYYLSD